MSNVHDQDFTVDISDLRPNGVPPRDEKTREIPRISEERRLSTEVDPRAASKVPRGLLDLSTGFRPNSHADSCG